MIPVNPGNLLPFYREGYSSNDRRWQRHRLPGQDTYPFGLPCPRTRLMPFQVMVEATGITVSSWALVNPEDDTETVILDETLLEVASDGTRTWVTWYADEALDTIPDCGYWYIFLNLGEAGGTMVSEVLDCRDMCGFETAGLTITEGSCAIDGSDISFQLAADVETASGATWTIERKSGITWSKIGTGNTVSVVETLASETRQYRIQVTTPCGLVITATYTATWDSGDGCGTLTLGTATVGINQAGILSTGPIYRLNFSNTTDKANVLYQNGYEQFLYLPLLVWDVPTVEREAEIAVNGNGEEIRRFTRTVERRGFEVPDLPDYVLGFLTKAGDLDTIKLEDAKMADALVQVEVEVTNLTFESPGRQGTALNVGRFYFDVEAEAFQGCQENFVLE